MYRYLVLLIYDVSDNKKRYRIDKKLRGYGFWVQRSAYECHLTELQYEKLLDEIVKYFDFKTDMLRVYKLTSDVEIKTFGGVKKTDHEDVIIV